MLDQSASHPLPYQNSKPGEVSSPFPERDDVLDTPLTKETEVDGGYG